MDLGEAIGRRRSCRRFGEEAVPLAAVKRLLAAGQGVTGGEGGRAAPSAHALYPLRLFLAAGRVDGFVPGLYRVETPSLALSLHRQEDVREKLERAALEEQPWIGKAAGIVTLCADMRAAIAAFAEQSPDGMRGERYACLEAGAAAQNILLQAVAEGLGAVLVAGFDDRATVEALGLPAALLPLTHICFGKAAG